MSQSDKNEVKKFYDDYIPHQTQIGINLRHLSIFRFLKQHGLKPHHRVLEIGCGIGPVTQLVAKYLRSGSVLGVDISEKSIELAQKLFENKPNASFLVSDMTDFEAEADSYDFIFMPDVLEHIPQDEHPRLFRTLRSVLKREGVLLIHIPNPRFLRWMHEAVPEQLQIIDQPLDTDQLLPAAYAADFYLDTLKTYSVFYQEPDYQLLVFRPNQPITQPARGNKYRLFLQRLLLRWS